MKKFILSLFCALVLISYSTKANMNVYDATEETEKPRTPGIQYHLKAMGGLSKNFVDDVFDYTQPCYTLGFQIRYQSESRLGFELNLDFSKKGGQDTYYNSRYRDTMGLSYSHLHSYYFDIAPAINYSFFDMQLYFGPYLGFCLGSIRESGHQYFSGDYTSIFDFGTYYGLRYDLFSFMQLDVNLSYGFKNLNTPKILYKDDVFMRNIVYRAGLVFKL